MDPIATAIEGYLRAQEAESDAQRLHASLAALQSSRLVPTTPEDATPVDAKLLGLEARYLAEERLAVSERARAVPRDPRGFCAWFDDLEHDGPGQGDALFDWLANDADLASMRWFLQQELAGEAGFDDLVALTQLRIPRRAKLELARNYWDEMGAGHLDGMHGPMLEVLASELGLQRLAPRDVVWESLALGNTLAGLAARREYAYQSIGALGAVERTAPGRARKVAAGLQRLGVGGAARRYYSLHGVLDVKHADRWRDEVLAPLVEERPELAQHLAEGALMRLEAGKRCFARYRLELRVTTTRGSHRAPVHVRAVDSSAAHTASADSAAVDSAEAAE